MILCLQTEAVRSVRELADNLAIRDALLSQHLTILRRDQIDKARREGHTTHYRIIREDVSQVLEFLHDTFCGLAAKRIE